MRAKLAVATLILLAACKKADTTDTSPPAADTAAPGINVSAAPGVAFQYDYAFKLAPTRIAAAQEAHQQACERLALAHCRITGWHYRVVGENDIQGSLTFLLDPAMARGFGKAAVAQVTQAGGSLAEAEITGTDAGAQIKAAQGTAAQANSEIERIDRQLARGDLPKAERETLEQQRADALGQAHVAAAQVAAGQASFATTPMTFDYQSGPVIQGFDASAPFTSATNLLLSSAEVTLAVVLTLLACGGPPVLVALAAWGLVRLVRRRWPRKATVSPAPLP